MPLALTFHSFTKLLAGVALCACALSLTACAADKASPKPSTELMVFGASSTRVLNEDLQARVNSIDPSLTLAFNNAGSSTLVQQLIDAAPSDLLLTASAKSMDDAVTAGVVGTPRTLASNTLVMVVPADNPAGIHSITDLRDEHTIVMCDPAVPCGDASASIMRDLDADIHPDSLEHQVADVLGKITSGNADVGWVYSTDAAAAGDKVKVIEIPGADKHPNDVMGAVVTHTTNADQATALLNLLAEDFRSEWLHHGFQPVGS